jgi:rubrerythrin
MPSQDDQLEAIGLIAAHENGVLDLYSAYAARFPDSADLFTSLATAERDHARRIADFAGQVRAGTVRINPGRFPHATLLNSLEFIREQVSEAQNPELTLVKALSVAHDLETGLIERCYFAVVEGDSPDLRSLLQLLAEETEDHCALLQEAWEKERQRSP